MIALLLDTETTGLIDNHTIKLEHQPHVIEFYSCLADLDTGGVIDEIDEIIRPPSSDSISEEITRITGITWEMVSNRPSFVDVSPRIVASIEAAPMIVAHNLSFDMEMIDLELERMGVKVRWPRRKICTVEQTIYVRGHRLNLSALHEMLFKEKFSGAHRAKVDVQALLRCCVELHRREMI